MCMIRLVCVLFVKQNEYLCGKIETQVDTEKGGPQYPPITNQDLCQTATLDFVPGTTLGFVPGLHISIHDRPAH